VINIIKEKLKEKASQKGVIFDGFPRTIQTLPTHLVINIVLNESILLEKSLARRTCVSCGKSYNSSIHRDGYEMDPFTATLRKMGSVISVAINW
jgi:adenylate kinase family enzyme